MAWELRWQRCPVGVVPRLLLVLALPVPVGFPEGAGFLPPGLQCQQTGYFRHLRCYRPERLLIRRLPAPAADQRYCAVRNGGGHHGVHGDCVPDPDCFCYRRFVVAGFAVVVLAACCPRPVNLLF